MTDSLIWITSRVSKDRINSQTKRRRKEICREEDAHATYLGNARINGMYGEKRGNEKEEI